MSPKSIIQTAILSIFVPASSAAQTPGPSKSFFQVEGLNVYYETFGSGRPLILLHGGVAAGEIFTDLIGRFTPNHLVIVPHMQGHGFTRDVDRPLTYERMADDIAGLMSHLKINHADIVGYSMGGGVATQVAIRHPHLVRRLAIISASLAHDGWYPEVVKAFGEMKSMPPQVGAGMSKSPMGQLYQDVDWTSLFHKIGEMESASFNWIKDAAKTASPTLLIYADADAVRPEHIVAVYKEFGGFIRDGALNGSGRGRAQLAIIPGTTHYDILSNPSVGDLIQRFLDTVDPSDR